MISFIIPAKNEEGYIAGCLASIAAQEIIEAFEIIVVDNGSTDRTAAKIKQYYPQTIIVAETKLGTSAARQKGFLEAQGDWLIFLDADVRLPGKKWLARLLDKINNSKVVAVSSHYRYYGVPWHQKFIQALGTFIFVYPWIFLTNNILHHSSHMIGGMMAIKKTVLMKAGGFSKEVEFYGDETLVAKKLFREGNIIVSPSLWVYTSGRRYQNQGMVKTVFKYILNYFWTLLVGKPYHKSI